MPTPDDVHTTSIADAAAYRQGPPLAEFARLRSQAPVAWVPEPTRRLRSGSGFVEHTGTGFWAVTRHETVVAASRQPTLFSSAARGAFLSDPKSWADLERSRQLLIGMDPPEHGVLRRRIVSAMPTRAALAQSIHDHAASLVSAFVAEGGGDVVADVAAELPLLVLADLLGVPSQDRHLFFEWSNNLVGFDDPDIGGNDVTTFTRTIAEAFGYARGLANDRRRSPRDDFVSALVTGPEPLDESAFCHAWLLMVVAGNETTRNAISGGMQAFVDHPEQWRRLQNDPGLTDSAVEEILRWVTPVVGFRRTPTCPVSIGDQQVERGDKVIVYYPSANRDEEVFDDAHIFDIGREHNPHVAFGGTGVHFCLGAHLARLELRIMFETLAARIDRVEPAGEPRRLRSNFINGIKAMPVRIHPRQR